MTDPLDSKKLKTKKVIVNRGSVSTYYQRAVSDLKVSKLRKETRRVSRILDNNKLSLI